MIARRNDYLHKIDQLIGEKIYSLRLAKGLSRQQLADIVEVTGQQLQKYERGINRISIGSLVLIAKALDKNIEYFYKDLEDADTVQPVFVENQHMYIEVSKNFMKIRSSEQQQAVNALIRSLITKEVETS